MPELGEYIVESIVVAPFDGTTSATLTVTDPAGEVTTPSTSSTDGGRTWTAVVHYTLIDVWKLLWEMTGTGAGTKSRAVKVDALYALPAWAPSRKAVADFIPGRTLVGAADGYGNALGTFDDTTHPTGLQVDRLIRAGCSWVSIKVGTVHLSLYDAATTTAALYTAWAVEQSWPDTSREQPIADNLWQRADGMRNDLAAANEAVNGTDPVDPYAHLMPVYSFPAPVPWGDQTFM